MARKMLKLMKMPQYCFECLGISSLDRGEPDPPKVSPEAFSVT